MQSWLSPSDVGNVISNRVAAKDTRRRESDGAAMIQESARAARSIGFPACSPHVTGPPIVAREVAQCASDRFGRASTHASGRCATHSLGGSAQRLRDCEIPADSPGATFCDWPTGLTINEAVGGQVRAGACRLDRLDDLLL